MFNYQKNKIICTKKEMSLIKDTPNSLKMSVDDQFLAPEITKKVWRAYISNSGGALF